MADLTITATSVVKGTGAVVKRAPAGETITAGQPVYLKAADSKLYMTQNDGTVAESKAAGIAVNGGAVNQPIEYQTDGELTIGGTLVTGDEYYVSGTLGGICPAADLTTGDYVVRLGYAKSTTVFVFDLNITNVQHD